MEPVAIPPPMDCILAAVFCHLGIQGLVPVEVREDRVFYSDSDGLLLAWCQDQHEAGKLTRDQEYQLRLHPGAVEGWREKNVRPALQICRIPTEDPRYACGNKFEVDGDKSPPQHALGGAIPHPNMIRHWGECLVNLFRQKKTDRRELVKLLADGRGICVG